MVYWSLLWLKEYIPVVRICWSGNFQNKCNWNYDFRGTFNTNLKVRDAIEPSDSGELDRYSKNETRLAKRFDFVYVL